MHDAPTHRANKPQAIAKPIDRCRLASPDAHASATFPSCPADLNATLERIRAGQHYPHRDDGTVFRNNEKLLPQKAEGYYHEWVHPTPGAHGPGARRVITTPGDDIYYTPDHYDTFILVER